MSDPLCAICRESVPLDVAHYQVTAEAFDPHGADDRDDYYLHVACAHSTMDGWREP